MAVDIDMFLQRPFDVTRRAWMLENAELFDRSTTASANLWVYNLHHDEDLQTDTDRGFVESSVARQLIQHKIRLIHSTDGGTIQQ